MVRENSAIVSCSLPQPSTSITSLLNSLHSHLQSQTQLLPTLHAQLGLPPTALADELQALQQSLTQCVEDQIDGRRREVEMWVARCDEAEEECQNYQTVLGSNLKGQIMTVGEIRKEPIFPRRYELLTELQEKLRQLYHTKLEQLLSLTSRLAVLARTLPDGFFPDELLEPIFDSYSSSYRDVTPEQFAKLEKELVRGKAETAKRLQALATILVQIDFLHSELGIPLPHIQDDLTPPAPSLAIPPISRPSSTLGNGHDPFLVATPTPATRPSAMLTSAGSSRSMLSSGYSTNGRSRDAEAEEPDEHACEQIFAQYAAAHANDDEEALSHSDVERARRLLVGLEHVEPSPTLLSWAQRTRAELEDLKRRREAHIQTMYDQLEVLWRRLGVAEADMDGFVEAHTGSTEETVREYEEELERMLELKRESMTQFIENARAEIIKLWDELMVGPEERQDFPPFFDDEHTEELLCLHELEIKRLKDERRQKAHLLGSIRKYFDICEEEKDLASSAADTTRLLGRGPRDPGRLLREEKMRKRVRKEKPRLEEELLTLIPAWEAETGRPFQVNGESLLQILLEASCGANDKENKRAARPGAPPPARGNSVPPRAITPTEPAPRRGIIRPASAGSYNGDPPNKRQRLGDSTDRGSNASSRGDGSFGKSSGKLAMPVPVRVGPGSALPRLVVAPRLGTQHAALGHGRVPSAHQSLSYSTRQASGTRATSASHRRDAPPRAPSNPATTARKASRARRESFRPRPSADGLWVLGMSGKYGGLSDGAVKEEEEDEADDG